MRKEQDYHIKANSIKKSLSMTALIIKDEIVLSFGGNSMNQKQSNQIILIVVD